MAQIRVNPAPWEIERESIELIPLTVTTYSASAADWVPTTSYLVSVVAASARPSSFASPTTDNGQTGYLANGPTLGVGRFVGFVKYDGAVQDPVYPAFTLRVK
jgi:hypothetical protein